MSWATGAFLDALPTGRYAPTYYLETVGSSFIYAGGHSIGGAVQLSSRPVDGYRDAIDPRGCSIQHARLQPVTWTRTHGTLTIATNLDPNDAGDRLILHNLRRGQMFRFRVELGPSVGVLAIETVWCGILRNVRWTMGGAYVLELVELIGGLTTRNTRDSSRAPLFSGLSSTTVATTDYVAGAATLTVADASGFEQASGHVHLIRVTPDTGNAFLLTATKSGNVFTVVARGIFDTADSDAAIGQAVEEIAYATHHPIETALRILVSTGLGVNGARDLLPERWGMGIPDALVDDAKSIQYQFRLGSASYVWYTRADTAESDGLAWLSEYLRAGGMFLAQRHGKIVVRPVHSWVFDVLEITDHDIAAIGLDYSAWDPDSPVEYGGWTTTFGTLVDSSTFTGDATTTDDTEATVESSPVRAPDEWNVPWVFRSDLDLGVTADAQVTAWDADITGRLFFWGTRVPERVTMRLARWTHAGACLGDTIRFTSEILRTRHENNDYSEGRYGIIVGGGPDWFRGGVEWDVLFPPTSAEG